MNRFKEKLKNYSIKKKLIASFGSISVIALIIGIVLLIGIQLVSSNIKSIFQGPMTNISDVGDVKYALTDLQMAINRLLAENGDGLTENYPTFEQTVEEDVAMVVSAVDSMDHHFKTAAGRSKLQELEAKIEEGEKVRPQVLELLKNGKFDEAYDLNYSTYLPIIDEIKALTEEIETLVNSNGQQVYVSSVRLSIVMIVIGVVLLIILVLIAIYLTKAVTEILTQPVKEMEEASKLMYQGDMSAGKLITYESEDELGVMAESMRGTMKNLEAYVTEISETLREIAKGDLTKDSNEITDFLGDFVSIKESFVYILKHFNTTLNNIQETSSQVEAGSAEISRAAADLSTGTTEQASAVEELTATVETVAALADKSATQTQEAYDKISAAVVTAEGEREKMNNLTAEMKNIIDISKQIEDITSAIEDIASQTSLLALNASIEAARAGEAGRGFAVVAEQIGKLAADSSASAVDTRELIKKTMEEINRGNAITESVAVAFETTINEMQNFAEVAKSTNESAKSQAEALSQIEAGIEQISGVTQNTAASTQESSAISEQLADRAAELDQLVKKFKLYSPGK